MIKKLILLLVIALLSFAGWKAFSRFQADSSQKQATEEWVLPELQQLRLSDEYAQELLDAAHATAFGEAYKLEPLALHDTFNKRVYTVALMRAMAEKAGTDGKNIAAAVLGLAR